MEISAAALAANLGAVRSVASAEAGMPVEVVAVVKANGYGHGASVAAKSLVQAGALWLGVTDVEEGIAVRAAVGLQPRILVMSGMEPEDGAALVANDLTPVVWTPAHIDALELAALELAALELTASAANRTLRVHVEIDTGMSRQGVVAGPDLDLLLSRLQLCRAVVCEGVFSHLASAEAGGVANELQANRFAAAVEQMSNAGVEPALVHLGNTSAVEEGSTMRGVAKIAQSLGADMMVRTGLALYGHALASEAGHGSGYGSGRGSGYASLLPELLPAMTWKTRITGLRVIEAGATVGYGSTFVATAPMKLALLPVGYADGFRREASSGMGNGWVMIAGHRAPVVGRVSMNLTVVDVTGLDPVRIGQEVVLLGDGVSVEAHAGWCGTIPYDVLCGIKARTKVV